MATKVAAVMVALVLLQQLVAWPSVEAARAPKAAASGPPATVICNMTEDGLTACKPAVTKPNPTDPTAECCAALSKADLPCLCSYKKSFVLPALGIDPDLAMGLPPKCQLTAPNCV